MATRWNAKLRMMHRALCLRTHIDTLMRTEQAAFTTSRHQGRDVDSNVVVPIDPRTNEQWTIIEELVSILEPAKTASEKLQGIGYPSLSLVFPCIHVLLTKPQSPAVSAMTSASQAVAHELVTQLQTRFEKATTAAIMSTFLDPCFKSLNFLNEEEKSIWEFVIKNTLAAASTSAISTSTSSSIPADQDDFFCLSLRPCCTIFVCVPISIV